MTRDLVVGVISTVEANRVFLAVFVGFLVPFWTSIFFYIIALDENELASNMVKIVKFLTTNLLLV